ncbi:MAG: c-type cytochrome [Paracoccaceae bacterium]
MFDTMFYTKVLAGFCATFLVFLLGGWAAESLYNTHHYGDEHHQAYSIEVPETGGEAEEVEAGPAFEEVYAMASAADGEALWRACSACHAQEPGVNGTGPYLHGVVGREIGAAQGYAAYSGALSAVADVWTPENLNGFLEDPRGWAPGTSMGYNGMRRVEDRANLIAYLDSLDD